MISTTIEQSQHLLELGLDPKTADMVWVRYAAGGYRLEVLHRELFERIMETDIAAWSLTALLEVMRKANAVTTLQVTSLSTLIRCKDMGFIWQNDLHIYDPTTAAYEMVCYLLRNNLIEKGGQDETDKRTS